MALLDEKMILEQLKQAKEFKLSSKVKNRIQGELRSMEQHYKRKRNISNIIKSTSAISAACVVAGIIGYMTVSTQKGSSINQQLHSTSTTATQTTKTNNSSQLSSENEVNNNQHYIYQGVTPVKNHLKFRLKVPTYVPPGYSFNSGSMDRRLAPYQISVRSEPNNNIQTVNAPIGPTVLTPTSVQYGMIVQSGKTNEFPQVPLKGDKVRSIMFDGVEVKVESTPDNVTHWYQAIIDGHYYTVYCNAQSYLTGQNIPHTAKQDDTFSLKILGSLIKGHKYLN